MKNLIFFLSVIITINFFSVLYGQENQPVDENTLIIQDNPPENNNKNDINKFTFFDFLRMVFVLGIVIGMIYGLYYFLKKISFKGLKENDIIKIHSTKILSNNKNLHVIEIGKKFLLIGASDGGVNILMEISDKETIDGIRLASEAHIEQGKSFNDIISDFVGRFKHKNIDKEIDTSISYLKKQKDKLKDL